MKIISRKLSNVKNQMESYRSYVCYKILNINVLE